MQRSSVIVLLTALLIGLAVGLGAYTFIYAKGYSYLTNNPAACANCHVMQPQYDAWMKSSHHSVAACNDCHTPHNLIGKYAVKANNGFWHSFYFTSGKYPDTIEITKFDHKVVESCLPPVPREHHGRHRRQRSSRQSRGAGVHALPQFGGPLGSSRGHPAALFEMKDGRWSRNVHDTN